MSNGKTVSERPSTNANLSSSAAKPSNKTGVIVGGVIGGVAVLALLSGIIVWTWVHHNRRSPEGHNIPQAAWIGQNRPGEDIVPRDNGVYEVDAFRPRAELEFRPIAELEPGPLVELGHSKTLHRR